MIGVPERIRLLVFDSKAYVSQGQGSPQILWLRLNPPVVACAMRFVRFNRELPRERSS